MPTERIFSIWTPGPIRFSIRIRSLRIPTCDIFAEPDHFTELDMTELERYQRNICDWRGTPADDVDFSGYLVLSQFGTCIFSFFSCMNFYVETNLS